MTDFDVSPNSLRNVGGSLDVLAGTISHARHNLDQMTVPDGGNLINIVAGQLDGLRADLEGPYSVGGLAESLLTGAGTAFEQMADGYELVDDAQRAAIDATLPDVDRSLTPRDDPAGIDTLAYEEEFGGVPESAFEAYDRWIGLRDGARDILNFGWVDDLLSWLGLPTVIDQIDGDFKGDWEKLGIAVGALANLQSFWQQVDLDLNGLASHMQDFWVGNAADSAVQWMLATGDAFREHASALSQYQSRVNAEATALYELWHLVDSNVGGIASALTELSDRLSDPKQWISWETGGKVGRLLFEIFAKIGKILAILDLAMSVIHLLVAGIAQLARIHDTDFPAIPSYVAPDVNGPDY